MDAPTKAALLMLLDEAYVTPEYKSTWFKDNEPNSSFIPSLRSLSAADACREPACGRHPVAGHANHLADSLEAAARAFRGEPYHCDWEASWQYPQPLTEEAWECLRDRLEGAYRQVRAAIEDNENWSDSAYATSVMALLAHGAYHLGAIRQIGADRLPHAS